MKRQNVGRALPAAVTIVAGSARPTCAILTFLVLAAPAMAWQPAAPATRPAGPETIKLTLHASPATQPVSRYRLLPDPGELTPGNAVTMYLLARRYWPDQKTTDGVLWPENRKYDYLDTPIDQFPRQYAHHLLEAYRDTLAYVDLGARRREAIWDTGWREPELRGSSRWGYVEDLRHAENLLSFRARLEISHQDWDAATHTMQTEFSVSRQMQTEPLLIHSLVAEAFAGITLSNSLEEWVSRDGSPNLYWALSDLPRPFVDPWPAAHDTEQTFRYWNPVLWQALQGQLPPQQWPQAIQEWVQLLEQFRSPAKKDPNAVRQEAKRLVELSLSRAKAYLVSNGFRPEQVDQMSPEQAVGEYFCRDYNHASNSLLKFFMLPYPQAEPRMLQAWRDLRPNETPELDNPLIQAMLPVSGGGAWNSMPRALFHRYELLRPERQIALMRTIEALRDYAARHDGQPPSRLDQVTELPVPSDPMSGKPFGYQLVGRTATLDAPSPTWRGRYSGWRYELTFEK